MASARRGARVVSRRSALGAARLCAGPPRRRHSSIGVRDLAVGLWITRHGERQHHPHPGAALRTSGVRAADRARCRDRFDRGGTTRRAGWPASRDSARQRSIRYQEQTMRLNVTASVIGILGSGLLVPAIAGAQTAAAVAPVYQQEVRTAGTQGVSGRMMASAVAKTTAG